MKEDKIETCLWYKILIYQTQTEQMVIQGRDGLWIYKFEC